MDNHNIREIQISYCPRRDNAVKISNSNDAYLAFMSSWNMDTVGLLEEFKVLLLNRGNIVLGIHTLSKGGISGTVVDLRLLMGTALKTVASSIILCHNHPSGNVKPSDQDRMLTERIRKAGALLDIRLLDHLIITEQEYFSFADEGLL